VTKAAKQEKTMNTWTLAAQDELNRFLARIRQPLEQAGADAAEVIDDIKRHIDEEIAAARLRVVTVSELKPMLARIGEPWRRESEIGDKATAAIMMQALKANGENREGSRDDSGDSPNGDTLIATEPPKDEPAGTPVRRGESKKSKTPPGRRAGHLAHHRPKIYQLILGVLFPLATLIIEWSTGFCAQNIFNPIPTVGHVLLVALVPIVNLVAWIAMFRNREDRFVRPLTFALGAALGVSIVYSVVYLPLAIPGIIAIVFGIGLLPLTPYFALGTSMSLRSLLKKRIEGVVATDTKLRFYAGILAAVALFLLIDIAFVGTTVLMHMAASPNTEETGIKLLKVFAHEETVLRACYNNGRSSRFAPTLFWLLERRNVSPEQARKIYYQLYGRAFNSVPAARPRMASLPAWQFEQPFDPERGGEKVGSPVPHLSLASSRIDATVEPKAAYAYLEWIVEFANGGVNDEEARCEIALPPGAVVSRLTLWINGEEREAAFAGRAQVRAAYEGVVAMRKDPVLVTSSGKDRILMQAFPVQPNNRMKMRVGMTVPLILDAEQNGILRWPYIRERNFALGEKLEHSFWIDSPTPVETLSIPLKTERTTSGHYMARGTLSERASGTIQPAVLIKRDPSVNTTWARDTRADDGSYVVQTIREQEAAAFNDVVLVLDGSVSMAEMAAKLGGLRLNMTRPLRVVLAGKSVREFTVENSEVLAGELKKVLFNGGQDNIPALERAWDLAAENGAGAIIWIHGPQPVLISSGEGLRQRFERRPNAVQLYDLPIERAPNAIVSDLPSGARYELVSMHRAPEQVFASLYRELNGKTKRYEAVREKSQSAPTGAESNLHLARLWAFDEVNRLVKNQQREQAINLAALYQLVTEVSGAVVLETAQQYKQAGLEPVDVKSVPSVPEPGTWALMLMGGALLIYFQRRRKSGTRPVAAV
jgi:hypothetical protein